MKHTRAVVGSATVSPALRRYLLFTAACTGAAVMIVEILGAKLLAPYFGTSHFVWTAQIDVTLVALACGYAAGGRLADASPLAAWLFGGLILAAAWLGVTVLAVEPAAYLCLRYELALGSVLAALLLFFVPLSLLAMAGPFLARLLAANVDTVGRTVGRITALSTLGSVVGTWMIGYVLIPRLPNSVTLYATALFLLTLAVAYFAIWERRRLAPAATAAAMAGFPGFLGAAKPMLDSQAGWRELFRGNSNFGQLQVVETEAGNRRYYLNDLLTQNGWDPQSGQSVTLFTHMLHGLTRGYAPDARDVLCIGMGVGIVPMTLAREGARVDVVEINPAVVPLAEQFFAFDPSRVRLTIGDGRQFIATAPPGSYDAIVLDAFVGDSAPSHLLTREAFAAMRRCLRPGGVLVMNLFGDFEAGRDFLVSSVACTLDVVFAGVRVHAAGNGNVFCVASDQAGLALRRLPDFDAVPLSIRGQAEAAFSGVRAVAREHGRVLTDDFNPVEAYDAANREQLRRTLALSYRPE